MSATKPSADQAILRAPDTMSDGRPVPPHHTSTLATSIPIVSTGVVGAISVDADGNVYTANFRTSVYRTRPNGDTVLVTDDFVQASGNFALPGGDLLQADYKENKIFRLRPDGTRNEFSAGGLDGPVGIARLPDGDFVVACHRGKYLARVPAAGGAAEEYFRDEQLAQPNGVVLDADGNIYIADLSRGEVFRLSPDKELSVLAALPGRGNAHNVIANGALYVNKIWDHVIYRVELDTGAYGIVSGNGRPGYDDGEIGASTIEEPNGIATDAAGEVVYFNTHRGIMGIDNPGVIILRTLAPSSGGAE